MPTNEKEVSTLPTNTEVLQGLLGRWSPLFFSPYGVADDKMGLLEFGDLVLVCVPWQFISVFWVFLGIKRRYPDVT